VERFGDVEAKDSKFENYDAKCTQRVRSSFRLPAVLIGLEESYNYATVQTAVMMAEEQVFGPERELFDEVINATIMKELDATGTYVFESKVMSVKFMDEQIKAMVLAKGLVENKSLVDAINESVGLELEFDAAADAMNKQFAQANPNQAQKGQQRSIARPIPKHCYRDLSGGDLELARPLAGDYGICFQPRPDQKNEINYATEAAV